MDEERKKEREETLVVWQLLMLESNTMNQVQFLYDAFCISHNAHTLGIEPAEEWLDVTPPWALAVSNKGLRVGEKCKKYKTR